MWVTVKNKQCDAVKCLCDFVIVDSYGCERLVPAGHWLLMLETGPIHLDDATFKAMFLEMPLPSMTYTYPPPGPEHWASYPTTSQHTVIYDGRKREADAKE